jgi:L-aspartate oxidase
MRFPSIFEYCRDLGFDMGKNLLPVTPAQHFLCGGVATDEHARTSVPRLLAVGEAACSGVHGANRLASTSLLEGLVYGRRAAEALECHSPPPVRSDAISPVVRDVPDCWEELQELMWTNVGIMRSTEKLASATERMAALEAKAEAACALGICTTGALSFRNAVATARAILTAATANGQSVGAHYREDVGPQ